MQLWIATSNQGKLNEFKLGLAKTEIQIHSPKELDFFASPKETGQTFEENARIKAKALHAVKPEVWVLGEDSGLEVPGLDNKPGIYSARYAGDKASDAENVAKLLKMIQIRNVAREAHFRCSIVLINPDGQQLAFSGSMSGEIAKAARGNQGFGYDPIFIPKGETSTLAELGYAYKHQHSHRAQAIRAMLAAIL